MPETKPKEPSSQVTPPLPAPPTSGPPSVAQEKTRLHPAHEAGKVPAAVQVTDRGPEARTIATAETKPLEARTPQAYRPPSRVNYVWIAGPIVLLLLILAIFSIRPRPKAGATIPEAGIPAGEEKPDLRNYSAFVAKNKALIEKYSEQVLTDDLFAGQAPLAPGASGPIVSAQVDPQLAALADALKIRVQVMLGSQELVRDNAVTRVTKGDFRGFRVQAFERLENGRVVSEETLVTTPRNGTIKTIGRVLTALQKADPEGIFDEVRAAGMEYSPLPDSSGGDKFRGQLRLLHYWGRPIPAERLISGASVGRVALGMPLTQLKGRIAATDSVLKRKVLINDVYHDVYKVMDLGGDPLFFVYEKEGKVLGIWVVSEVFRTGKGIGINSTLDQIRISYPAVTLSRSEKKTPFVKVDGVAGILVIQGEGEKKVVAILMGDSPEFN